MKKHTFALLAAVSFGLAACGGNDNSDASSASATSADSAPSPAADASKSSVASPSPGANAESAWSGSAPGNNPTIAPNSAASSAAADLPGSTPTPSVNSSSAWDSDPAASGQGTGPSGSVPNSGGMAPSEPDQAPAGAGGGSAAPGASSSTSGSPSAPAPGAGGHATTPSGSQNGAALSPSPATAGVQLAAAAAAAPVASTQTATQALRCASSSQAGASGGSGGISADTPPASDGTRLYPLGSAFTLRYTTGTRSSADTLAWTVSDHLGKVVAQGKVAVPAAATTTTLNCVSSLAGYFAASGTLSKAGGQVARRGSAPAGITSFGVLPDIPAPSYTSLDQRRFGYQGFNDNGAVLGKLGASWQLDDRQMAVTEPNGRNQFNPATYPVDSFYSSGDAGRANAQRLVRLDGLPSFESPSGSSYDASNAPVDLPYYQNYMARVGRDTEALRAKYFPSQKGNYYQVTWEPQWNDSDANFVAMYKAAYAGLHSTDPKAVVMGPADPFPSLTTDRLKRLAPLGFAKYVDAIATHGYYDAGTSPSHPPERHDTDSNPADAANSLRNEMRNLRAEMAADYKSSARLFVTETGISYDLGSTYDNYPASQLYAQGAVTARAHIILLGEGADKTFFFFGPDYPDEVGYGTFFDFDHRQGLFGASNIGPKPAAMTIAALTRLLSSTTTLGPVKSTPAGIYAYSFQRRGSGKIITAAWQHNNATWSAAAGFNGTAVRAYSLVVDAPGSSGTVTILDSMGNSRSQSYSNGQVALSLTESPQYVVSGNASVSKANATTPKGYVAS